MHVYIHTYIYIYIATYIHIIQPCFYYIAIDFGPPKVTLNCLVDYVKLNKVVEVLWKPTLKNGSRTPLSSIDCCIENCEANINCGHGYRSLVSTGIVSYYISFMNFFNSMDVHLNQKKMVLQ